MEEQNTNSSESLTALYIHEAADLLKMANVK